MSNNKSFGVGSRDRWIEKEQLKNSDDWPEEGTGRKWQRQALTYIDQRFFKIF
jgi:hypothetical protein